MNILHYSLHPYPNFHNFCRLKLHWFMMLFTSTPKLCMISIDRKKSIPNPSPAMELKLGSMEIPSSIIWNWWVGEMINYYSRTLTCTVYTMRTNLPKLLDLLIFCIYSLNSLEFFNMIFFVTNQLNISIFLPLQIRKTLISY